MLNKAIPSNKKVTPIIRPITHALEKGQLVSTIPPRIKEITPLNRLKNLADELRPKETTTALKPLIKK